VRGLWWKSLGVVVLLIAAALLNGCSSGPAKRNPFAGVGSPVYPGSGPLPKGGGKYLIGEPYEVAGWKYHPREDPSYDKVGQASWYGPQFHRRMTSNGEWFDMDYLSAAHPTLPLPSYVRVTNLENGRAVVVRVNDRGPFVGDRIIDMSRKSAEVLGFKQKGRANVRVQYLGPAPLNDRGSDLIAMNRRVDNRGGSTEMAAARPIVPAVATTALPQRQRYYVQIGAYSDPRNADRAREALRPVGPVSVTSIAGQLGTLYKVELGPLDDQGRAAAALDQVVAQGHSDARLVRATNWSD
jgi:peptidoglycan lytic transglycosylase